MSIEMLCHKHEGHIDMTTQELRIEKSFCVLRAWYVLNEVLQTL